MSVEELETILTDLKVSHNLNFIDIKCDDKVYYILKDFIFILTNLKSSNDIYDILYIDNENLNIIEDSKYKIIVMKTNGKYKIIDTTIINKPTLILKS